MLHEGKIWVGTGNMPAFLLPQMANRHGLIAGATGTGKTVTLKVLAEGFSQMGVPVFLSDVKGDLAGMIKPGEHSDALAARLAQVGVPSFGYQGYPTIFWDVYGKQGHPIRATVSEMGPLLLSRMLDLNDTQTGVLNILFRVADDEGMLLLDLKDLKAMLAYLGEHSKEYTLQYGNVSAASIGAIQRAVLRLEDQGGDRFFGEPALNIVDWMQLDDQGRGAINILAADQLMLNPTMYSTFLLWMLSELYELLPEQGDLPKPRMVFFFDEAHLLFNECPKPLLEKIEQVVRLIRSKGVGVYFITQNPADIPMTILSQLGNRVQHCLRAYTPLDQRGVKAAADTFRTNPAFDTAETITQLKTGEALVSFLDGEGAPTMVEKATILPPQSFMGAITAEERNEIMRNSPLKGLYDEAVDRQSAYEVLSVSLQGGHRMMPKAQPAPQQPTITFAPQQPVMPQSFMVFDPTTGQYVSRPLESLPAAQPAAQQPIAQQPIAQQPVAQQPVAQPMPVLMFDPTTGQYVQQTLPMQYDAATGTYVPAVQQSAIQQPAMQQSMAQQPAAMTKEQQKAQKEAEAAARRKRTDELREERADRARKNDSVVGRLKNTAISTVSREVTRTLTRGILGVFTGK